MLVSEIIVLMVTGQNLMLSVQFSNLSSIFGIPCSYTRIGIKGFPVAVGDLEILKRGQDILFPFLDNGRPFQKLIFFEIRCDQ